MKNYLSIVFFGFLTGCSPATTEVVLINGVDISYAVQGNGPPLYMLHGGMESRNSFDNQISVFSKHFTVIAPDSREQGRSGSSESQISYELMSKDVTALAQYFGHDRISIMGLSDGGVTALTTAIRNPNLVDKLVLLGATFHYDSYSPETHEFIASYEWDGSTDPSKYPGNFIEHYLTGHNDLSNFGESLKEMSVMWTTSPTFTKLDLNEIDAQTLVINGDHEDTVLEHALELYAEIKNAHLFVVPDATHYSLQEKPELVNEVMMNFLREN